MNVIKSVYKNNSLEKADVIIEEKDYKRIILGLYTWYRFSEKESKFVKIKDTPSKLPFPEVVPSFIVPDLEKIIHYENLKQCLNLGLKITRIRRGIKFKESQWLKKYIALNTDLRTKARNEFEKDFFKLMNNSVFGKTMENIRNRVNIKLVTDKKNAERLVAKPNFKHCYIFDEDLIAIHMKKTSLTMNKPV